MDPVNLPSAITSLDNRASTSSVASQTTTDQTLFLELLSGILSTNGSGTSGSSLGSGDLLTPVLMTLVEQILAEQVQSQGSASIDAQSVFKLPSSADLQTVFSGASSGPQGLPVHGSLTQDFHPGHNGLDFGVVVGTPAKATMSGRVVYAGWNNQGYGNLVIIQNGPYQVYYGHLSEMPVQVGQTVTAGQTIGLTGNTGHSTGPHLHYEVRMNGKPIDPTTFTLG